MVLPLATAAPAGAAVRPPGERAALTAAAESLFVDGEFGAADSLYTRILAGAPRDTLALRRRGMVALFENRLADARRWLTAALGISPAGRELRSQLAESHYRADEFGPVARLYRQLGREARAAQLESFAGRKPYRTDGSGAEVPFVQTDPLPVIEARVNGSGPVFFLIDTGASELILDSEFADSVGAGRFGADSATFAGDRRAQVEYGRADSVILGNLAVHDVPVRILSTRRFAAAAGGRRVDGIVGTVFLYHFLATLVRGDGRRRPGEGHAVQPGLAQPGAGGPAADHRVLRAVPARPRDGPGLSHRRAHLARLPPSLPADDGLRPDALLPALNRPERGEARRPPARAR